MGPKFLIAVSLFLGMTAGVLWHSARSDDRETRFSDTEIEFESVTSELVPEELVADVPSEGGAIARLVSLPPIVEPRQNGRIRWSAYWEEMTPEEEQVYGSLERPDGPLRVGLQAGHWQLGEVPEELDRLSGGGGAQGEQKAVLEIARQTKALLEAEGIVVDLFPVVIPVDYVADAFVSIHADGSSSAAVSGFKISGPRRDFSQRAEALADALYESYARETGLRRDANVTRRMSGYYAFNWRRYDHAVHPMTPSVIVETGFMTSPVDRAVIVGDPERAAKGIAGGIISFLR